VSRKEILATQQILLKEDIGRMLGSFLIGTVAKPPSMSGYNLTTKVAGKTKTLYVRKERVPMAIEMSNRYKQLWKLLQALSKINWELLKLQDE
jgi:hypothetical protein